MQEECLDIGSYLEMWDQKYTSKVASTAAQKTRAYFILGYGMLKELEELERTLTREVMPESPQTDHPVSDGAEV